MLILNKNPKDEYINKSMLKQRGWTESMIKKILGNEDASKDNPMYKSAPPMKLYLMKRVIDAEATDEFIKRKIRAESRSKTMKNIAENKRQELLDKIEKMTFKIRVIPEKQLLNNAIKSYNDFHEMIAMERNNFDYDYATPKSDRNFLERIEVNYIRHNLTKYDNTLENLAGKIGINDAAIKIKFLILDAISEKYPYLQNACNEQKNRIKDVLSEK